MMRFLIFSLILLTSACAAPRTMRPQIDPGLTQAEVRKQQEIALNESWKDAQKLQRLSYPVLVSGADLCGKDVQPIFGYALMTPTLFEDQLRETARAVFGLHQARPVIKYITPGSPAARAGLQAGDVIMAVNGQILPENDQSLKKYQEIITDLKLRTGQSVSLLVRRGLQDLNITVTPATGCAFPVLLNNGQDINAYADGKQIHIMRGLIRFAENDSQLAMVIAHELAHNAMGHIDAKQQNVLVGSILGSVIDIAVGGNGFGRAGASIGAGAYSQDFESEADYVGLYILARAGFDISQSPYFWRRMASTTDAKNVSLGTSHPSSAQRFVQMEATIAEIQQKIKSGAPLMPQLKN